MLKKIIVPMMMVLLVSGQLLPVAASENDVEVPNIGVSEICPDGKVSTINSERPSKVWNIKKNGRYDFSGTANNICIYTNYKFTGKTGYKYYVKNTGKHSMVVKAKRLTKTYAKTTISAGDSATANFSDIKSSTEFYMTFDGSKFEGYIK